MHFHDGDEVHEFRWGIVARSRQMNPVSRRFEIGPAMPISATGLGEKNGRGERI